MEITIPETTIAIPKLTTVVRSWKWGLLAILALALTLTGGGRPEPAEGAFPGANGKIAFHSLQTGNFEVLVMNADGSGQTNLTNNAAADSAPAWSSDGTQIAFTSNRDAGNFDIYKMNADGSGQTRLTTDGSEDAFPAWSPDGTRIAFRSVRDGNQEIYVMFANGSLQTRLTFNTASDAFPNWSPDGTQIAFSSERDGNSEIYVMNANGSGQTRLTFDAAGDAFPDWSPDGTQIAFHSDREVDREIFVMNADGTGQTNLTNNAVFDSSAAWSPDGTQIAFYSDRDGDAEIFVMNADGSGQTQLTNNLSADVHPAWQPVPQIRITNLGQYALPKSCFQVTDVSQSPLFTVCDNDFQGAPASNAACVPDGVCEDEDPADGSIHVSVSAGTYNVSESKAPPSHTADASKLSCDTVGGGTCQLTFVNEPDTKPWFPWDTDNDGQVGFGDFLLLLQHYNQTKP